MGVAHGAPRMPALREAEYERFQIERLEPVEPDFAQRGAHVKREERPVIACGFGARDLGEETGESGRGTLAVHRPNFN